MYLLTGAVSLVTYGLVMLAVRRAPVGYVAALRESSVLVAAFIGWKYLDEGSAHSRGRLIVTGLALWWSPGSWARCASCTCRRWRPDRIGPAFARCGPESDRATARLSSCGHEHDRPALPRRPRREPAPARRRCWPPANSALPTRSRPRSCARSRTSRSPTRSPSSRRSACGPSPTASSAGPGSTSTSSNSSTASPSRATSPPAPTPPRPST